MIAEKNGPAAGGARNVGPPTRAGGRLGVPTNHDRANCTHRGKRIYSAELPTRENVCKRFSATTADRAQTQEENGLWELIHGSVGSSRRPRSAPSDGADAEVTRGLRCSSRRSSPTGKRSRTRTGPRPSPGDDLKETKEKIIRHELGTVHTSDRWSQTRPPDDQLRVGYPAIRFSLMSCKSSRA